MILLVLHPTQTVFLEEGISLYLEDYTKLRLFMPFYYIFIRKHKEHELLSHHRWF